MKRDFLLVVNYRSLSFMTEEERKAHFERFMDTLDDYLYSVGWYVQGQRMRARGLSTFQQVEDYLVDHCYGRTEAQEIVARIKLQTL